MPGWGSNRGPALEYSPLPENVAIPAQSDTGTARSEARGLHNLHTPCLPFQSTIYRCRAPHPLRKDAALVSTGRSTRCNTLPGVVLGDVREPVIDHLQAECDGVLLSNHGGPARRLAAALNVTFDGLPGAESCSGDYRTLWTRSEVPGFLPGPSHACHGRKVDAEVPTKGP